MTNDRIICAGFGGQGVLQIGRTIAAAGLAEGKEVSWLPSYGTEMRGGTANCSVVVSDTIVASPILTSVNVLMVLNSPSLVKFEQKLIEDGILIINSSLVTTKPQKEHKHIYYIPGNELANAEGNTRGLNMVMVGVYVALTGTVSLESALKEVDNYFTGRKAAYALANKKCVEAGYQYVRKTYPNAFKG